MQRRGRLTEIQVEASPEEAVLKAGSDWLEAEEDADYERARGRFLGMAQRWLHSMGWRPPIQTKTNGNHFLVVQLILPLKDRRIKSTIAARRRFVQGA
jgi:hypothetical protein